MAKTNWHLLLAVPIAMLGVFLFVGSVSADDSSTATPVAQPTVVATDPSTQATDAISLATAAPTLEAITDVSTPEATATPALPTTPDEIATAVGTPTPEDTTTPADTLTPEPYLSATATVDATDPVNATPEDTTPPVAAVTETVTAAHTTDAAQPATPVSLVNISSSGDPYFKVGAVEYAFETASGLCPSGTVLNTTCFVSATPITAAINYINTNGLIPTDKKVYIEQGSYTENVSIDGSSSVPLSQLVGLIGVDGSTLTTLNGSVTVTNTKSGFTLQGLNIAGSVANGLVTFDANTGALQITDVVAKNTNASGDGIVVTNQTGAVTLTNVDSSDNQFEGANITATGNVTINNASFDRNAGTNSLQVNTSGSITMNGVSSSLDAAGSGADLKASKGITLNYSHFEQNANYGVYIEPATTGTITMNTVFANGNGGSNIYLDKVNGAVTLTSVEAGSSEYGYGLYIDNCAVSGPACTSSVAGAIALTNLSVSSNQKANINITSSGAITASNITANYSSSDNGGYFDNRYAKSPQNISISSGDFGGSHLNGLVVNTKGSVTLNDIQSNGNGNQDGINVDATAGTGTVTVLNTLGQNSANSNPRYGLVVFAKGNISVNGISAASDHSMGIDLVNTSGTGSVTLNNAELDNDGTAASDDALNISSNGAISVLNSTSEHDHGNGVWLSNQAAASAQSVTVTNCTISDNNTDGLIILSKGNVTVSGSSYIESNNQITVNDGGLFIDNTSGNGTVTVSNTHVNNNNKGINILSKGNILLNTSEANGNVNEGAILTMNTGSTATITVNNSIFNYNGSWGLNATAKGTITLTSIYADGDNTTGSHPYSVNLDNSGGTGGVVLNGTGNTWNYIGYNTTGGLNIATNGAVTINYIETQTNQGIGINIHDTGTAAVTLSHADSYSNSDAGIYIIAKGTITLNNPDVTGNQGATAGVYLHNDTGTGGVIVQGTSTDWGEIEDNYSTGNLGEELDIKTKGAVTINYLDLSDSPQEDGLYVDNTGGTGAVSINQVWSSSNGGSGAEILSKGSVTVSGLETNDNGSWGLNVITHGTITLTSIFSNDDNSTASNAYAVNLNNSGGTGGVAIKGTNNGWNVINNDSEGGGLYINTKGAITINYIETVGNGGKGLEISDTGTGAVTISNADSVSNTDTGILVNAMGTITLNNPYVENNQAANAGVSLNNTSGTGGVVVQGTSANHGEIINNYKGSAGDELDIVTKGTVTLGYLDLSQSPLVGLSINNSGGTGAVSLNTISSNTNGSEGVQITSHGAVTVTGLNANSNHLFGLYIQNKDGAAANVSLSNVTTNSNVGTGMDILSKGAVTLTGITSSYNTSGGYGVSVDNTFGGGGITLTNSGSAMNNFDQNTASGVYFNTNGSVVINNTEADQNTQYGISVPNASATGPITLKTVKAGSNMYDGIDLFTQGSVTISGVDASHNTMDGLYILNATLTGNVTITNGNFYDNSGSLSLNVLSKGAISLTNVTADDNNSGCLISCYAAYLSNFGSSGTPGVTVQNSGTLMNSFGYSKAGLNILSNGAVVLGNINANEDTNTSILVDNTSGTAGVTLTNINVSSNNGDVLDVVTNGAVTGSKLSSQGNGSNHAIYIDNCQLAGSLCAGSGNVTLTTVTANNGGTGLYVSSNGSISVSSLTAQNNGGGFGADLENSYSSVAGSVSVLSAYVIDNMQDGIHIVSKGSVTLDGITSNGNQSSAYGVYVDNSTGTGNVSVLNTKGANTFNDNSADGLYINTKGAIIVTSATASNNVTNGLNLNTSGTAKTITLTNVTTSHNGYDGILTLSHGATTFTNIKAFNNGDTLGYDGINVTTNGYDFTLSNSYISGNGENGIYAMVGGTAHNVKVIKSYYFGNGQFGSTDAPDIVTDGKLTFA
jgi:hypothetical protein